MIRLLGSALIVCGLVAITAQAQVPAPQQPPRDSSPPGPATNTAVIRGRVIDAQTAAPLRRVHVTLTAPGLARQGLSASTDDDGRFEITEVPAGRVTVAVERSGYLRMQYGQRRPREQGKPLDLAAGQRIDDVDFALPRMAVIAGHITDELGEPIADVTVSAHRWMYVNNRRQLLPDGPIASTDEDGEYRLVGLVPGTYVVRAKTLEKWTVQIASRDQTMSYAPTFYPSVTDAAQAARVDVTTGQQVGNIDFALVPGRAAKLLGTAVDSKGRPLQNLILVNELLGPNGGMVGIAGNGSIRPDGTFEIVNVPPGGYKLQATSPGESVVLPIEVNGADINGISLTASAGWSVKGTVAFDSRSAATLRRNQVTIAPVALAGPNGMGMPGGAVTRQIVNDDWTFSVTGVVGPARLRVTLPEGWAVKAVRQGDRDVADLSFDMKSGEELAGIVVVATDDVGSITGQILDPKTSATSDGTVVLFPVDSSKWFEGSRFVRTTRPDQQGRYRITGVLPGDYLAVALDYVEQGVWNDPEYLESLRRHGQKVTLAAGATQVLSLTVVTP